MKTLFVLLLLPLLFLTSKGLSARDGDEAKDKYRIKSVVIDPGHGGKDPGALGSSSKEKDIALAVGLKLGEYIHENFPDVKVIFTRKTDVFVELHERAAIANRANADLFISVHCNASPAHSAYGTEIYILGLHKTQANLNVAKRENSVILMEDNYSEHYDGFDPNQPIADILLSLYQGAHLKQSIQFAGEVDNQFATRVHRKSRGVHQAGFMVLYRSSMPSVLVELGFITNKNEEAFLLSEEGVVYMASAIYRAFKEYKTNLESGISDGPLVKDIKKEEVTFKVQFLVSSYKLDELDDKYTGIIDNFEIEESSYNFYRYLTGSFNDYKEAVMYQKQLREQGLTDAFVVAYRDGKRITIHEAIGIVQN